ncbi:MAG: polymer-forming cytoskeletal protein [Bacteroidota bacterium]|nr:polymer-forming cytoskeletal protein [Bacteroidota bacterium]
MAKGKETELPSINLLGPGTVVKGEIKLNGDFRIDGTFIGQINCKGKIVVGPSGIIEGEIVCQNADFSGDIKATVKVAELLTFKETAKFCGDVTTNKLAIEPGALFSGTCTMESLTPKPVPEQAQKKDELRPQEKLA